jgi:hypothetical protein
MWARSMGGAVLALSVLLLASACGGGGGGSKDAVSVSSTTATKPVRPKAVCLKLAQGVGEATLEISQGMAGTIFAWDPLADGDGFHARDVARDSRKFALVAAGAPDEVKAPFGLLNRTLERLADSVRGIDLDGTTPASADQHAQLEAFQSKTDRRQLARAQERLTNWFSTRCPYY